MMERVNHCPFLNRADSRCSNHFSLDRLGHAFDHCFGSYKTCPTYLELLVERRVRRSGDTILRSRGDAIETDRSDLEHAAAHAHARPHSPFIQLRIASSSHASPAVSSPVPARQGAHRYHQSVA